MNSVVVAAIVGSAGTALGAAGKWLLDRANYQSSHSGSVRTSDAQTIFDAGEEIRQELRSRIADQDQKIARLDAKITSQQQTIDAQQQTILSLQIKAVRNQTLIDELRSSTALSKTEAAILRKKVEQQAADFGIVRREMNIAREGDE